MNETRLGYDLHLTGLEVTLNEHRKQTGHEPTTLIVAADSDMIHKAYLLTSGEFPGVPRMLVVPVPGLSIETWMVASPRALVINHG